MKGFFRLGSPIIELKIEGRKVEALLDTGFNGHILLPNSIIQELGLDQIGISDYVTASGDNSFTKVYAGKILFLEEEIEVPILSTDADFALAGMELFDSCKIMIERKKEIVEVVKSR
ncbi:clan AA aspartic protease [Candidatus Woesearchaeota archaeon]|nr:clan AA aspartic protease [Candidatus Woesearchaeota archaeon]